MTICDICNRAVSFVTLQKSIHSSVITRYCDMCWYVKNAPILVLTKRWGSADTYSVCGNQEMSNLYSPKLGKNVYPSRNQMDLCGFTLFNRKTYFEKKANDQYREVMTYKYRGPLRCLALGDYKKWPRDMKLCDRIGCNLY